MPEAVYRIPHGGSSASGRFRPPPGLEEVGASGSSQLAQARPADTPVVPFWCSKGSFGHPQLCGRPCVHVAKGGVCPSGLACTYCHFLPHAAVVKPGGSMRRTLLAATDQELLATFLPFIRKKAGKEGLLPLANDLINLLEAEMHEPPPTSISLVSFRPMKMTFMRLGFPEVNRSTSIESFFASSCSRKRYRNPNTQEQGQKRKVTLFVLILLFKPTVTSFLWYHGRQ